MDWLQSAIHAVSTSVAVGSAVQISSSLFQFFNKSKSALKGPSDLNPTVNDVLTAGIQIQIISHLVYSNL